MASRPMQRTFAAITSVATFLLLLNRQPPLRAQEPVPLNVPNESLHAQANALFEAGRFSEALPVAEQLLAARREQLGAEHVDVARSLHFLGLIHDRLEHGPEAERHYLEAVAMAERLLGPEHLLVALSAQQLGDWYCRHRRAEAEQWLARALRIREQQLGDSAEVAETLESLARWHLQRETDGEGFPLAERAAQICFTSLQWPDDRTARAFDTLGALAKRLGKLEVAISAREQTFWSYEALYGWSELRTHRGGRFLARHLMEAGELVRARALLDRIVHAPMPKGTAEERGLAWSALGECFAKQKEVEKAVEAHRQCVLLENQIAGGGDSRTIMHAKVEIANALFSLKRFSEAEPLYLDRLERFAKAGNALQVRFMHEWLGSFYAQWGDTEKAERYLLESLALAERLPNQPHLAVGDAAFALAKFLKERGEFVRAAPLFERSFDVHATLLDEAKWDLFRLEEAAWFYEKANNPRAMELSVRLSQLWEKRSGLLDPHTAEVLRRTARCFWTFGRKGDAEETYKREIEVRRQLAKEGSEALIFSLNDLGRLYEGQQQYAKAQPLREEALQLSERLFGSAHPRTLTSLRELAHLWENRQEYVKAENLYRQALERSETAQGSESAEVADALYDLGTLYRRQEDFARAEPALLRAFAIREKRLGTSNAETVSCMDALAECYRKKLDYAKAVSWQQRVLDARRETLGPEHRRTIAALRDLGLIYEDMREFTKALELRREALQLSEKVFGVGAKETISEISGLASTHLEAREFADAERLYRRALELREQLDGQETEATASSCQALARCYREMLEFTQAQALYERALTIRQKLFGDESEQVIGTLSRLADMFEKAGNFVEVAGTHRRIVAIRTRVNGADHAETGNALLQLGMAEYAQGQYSAAIKTFAGALPILEKAFGSEHVVFGRAMGWLGLSYFAAGDFADAEPRLRANYELQTKLFGHEHQYTGAALSQLGLLYFNMGEFARAEEALRKALAIARRTVGDADVSTFSIVAILAGASAMQGRTDDVAMAEQALARCEETFGPDHPFVYALLKPVALLHQHQGRLAEARRETERLLRLGAATQGAETAEMASTHLTYALLCAADGIYLEAGEHAERALAIAQKALGGTSALETIAAKLLAAARISLGDREGALAASRIGQQASERSMANLLSFTSEEQRLAWPQYGPHDIAATLGDAAGLAQSVLRLKGLILDSLLEDRAVAFEADLSGQAERLHELQSLKRQLFQSGRQVGPLAAPDQAQSAAAELRSRIERLEAGMAAALRTAGRSRAALGVTTESIQAALPFDGVLVEFLRYDHVRRGTETEGRYGALLIAPDTPPRWIAMGQAAELEKEVRICRKSARGETDEATLRKSLERLHGMLWAPLQEAFPEQTRTVIVSPDGELSFISFATLISADNHFVAEKYSVRYVASGRDLLRETALSPNPSMLLFADAAFADEPTATATITTTSRAVRALEMRDLRDLPLPRLPGSAEEAAALETRAKAAGQPVQIFLGQKATEAELHQLHAPRVLHLATHGFLLPQVELPESSAFAGGADPKPGKLVNPMHRSGLALAGAQRTLRAWGRGEAAPAPENDGVVTAEEVGGLDLKGTWLVVLSACETGLGDARKGEGVMGLRRGFVQAGAQNLLMTLWPVSDKTTVRIMLDFYAAAERTQNAPQALADVQRDWLVKLRAERGLQAAVQLAGAFIMNSQGRPNTARTSSN